ncbi:dTDP-4-dehydrorhamnose reductase [Winogradskyella wandonensis]|uniref:dTDP-4-dehydrorhamnose reductase n=1 Tax=Winogradskyella wandonensis TaxID=1442586 RepID=A0A4R1KS09_9FLAO|nr:dTDP-4-dehydrorhamnose reductase [Winogradskyella wandonensis]TCK67814.1 dTDP-4-dehydrorhamnose reductase [Winogradskyella wandonensis]
MISVLVTGKDSQLGLCIRDLQDSHTEILFDFKNSKELDITSEQSIAKTFEANAYDYCVNCAAYTAVDKAETEPEKAKLINTIGVKNLALACKNHGVVLIHISTDFVFDGKKKTPYTEEDLTNPINVYGKTKRDGEIEIDRVLDRYFIIRTSWLYSQYGNNFVKTILRLAEEKDEINVVDDQLGSPTNANNLAELIVKLISTKNKAYGIYHFSDKGTTSWYGFAREIFSRSGVKVQLNNITSSGFYTAAKRPKYSVLDTSKISKEIGLISKDWKDGLKRLFFQTNISSDL